MEHVTGKALGILMVCSICLLSGCSTEQVGNKLEWLDKKIEQGLKKMENTDISAPISTTTPTTTEEQKSGEAKEAIESARDLTEEQKEKIDQWLEKEGYNRYGDDNNAIYSGGTPLFDEKTGEKINRYEYLLDKFPNILERIKQEGGR